MSNGMPVSVKVYLCPGQQGSSTALEIRRFIFRYELQRPAIANCHSTSHCSQPAGSSAYSVVNHMPSRPTQQPGIYSALLEKIRALYNGLNLHDVNLCWKDDDGDYVVFSSDDELRVAINNTKDNTLRIYIREKECFGARQRRRAALEGGASTNGRASEKSGSFRNRDPPVARQTEQVMSETPEEDDEGRTSSDSCTPITVNHDALDNNYRILCSECRGEGRGVWYKCTVCQNYFLCSDCENQGLHDRHIMIRTATGLTTVSPR